MMILLNIAIVIVGFLLLIKGADWFVDASSNIAKHFHISEVIIGLTLVAFGTSFPELAVSLTAAIDKSNGIAVGNVVGSNIFNICMVLGVVAMIKPIPVEKSLIKKDLLMSIMSAVVLFLVIFDSIFGAENDFISRADGLILLCFFAIFMYYTITSARQKKEERVEENKEKFSYLKNILLILIGAVAIVGGGKLVVYGSSQIALSFGLSEALIGLTIVSLGTSLPEFVTSLVAMLKSKSGIAVGNAVGSNIFNAFFILGTSSSICPIIMNNTSLVVDGLVLLFVSILIFIFPLIKKREINRKEGTILFLTYIAYTVYIIIRN